MVSHKSIPRRWGLRQWEQQTEGDWSVQGRALAGVSREKEMGKGKQANCFQKHSMKKTLLLQIGFRKSTQCICWDFWPGQNSTELSQLANNPWVQKSSVLRINHFTDSTWKKYCPGDKPQETRKTDRDVTADTFQSTGEHCCEPDARTAHLHPLLQMRALAVQPTLDISFSLSIYPKKSRLPSNLDFSSIKPRFSIRELTWKFSPAQSIASCNSPVIYSTSEILKLPSKEGQSHRSGPLHQSQSSTEKIYGKHKKQHSTTLHRNGPILPTSSTWVLFSFDTPVIHHSATCP